jgi:Domain of unknown function (DUF3846)
VEITAILIPANQAAPVKLRKLDRHDLAAYQALVGGNIEPINLDAPAASMYVNEEGKLLHLPLNMRATHVVWAHNERLRNEDIVMGDAFILGPVDRKGNDTSAPQSYINLLFPTEPFRIEVLARGETIWAGNAMLYETWEQAYIAADSLHRRWTLAEKLRIVPRSTPTRQRYEEGSQDIG